MSIPSVDLILFAVQAGIRLVQTGRKVYVAATIGGEVEIPLPPVLARGPLLMAIDYARYLKGGTDQQKKWFTKYYETAVTEVYGDDAEKKQKAEGILVQQYLSDVAHGLVPSLEPSLAGIASIYVIKQWSEGESPFPSAFQRIVGSLVEISIDYFIQVPGAVNENSKQGKVLKSFLLGLSDVSFEDARWDSIAISLFTTALDTFRDHPDLITNESDEQSLIQNIVSGVATDIAGKLKSDDIGSLDAEDRLKRFGQILLRSLLKNGGTAVLDSPSILTGSKAGQILVKSVGSAFLNLLLKEDNAQLSKALQDVASTEGFDTLIRAALKVVVEHPEHFQTGDKAVDKWLNGVLSDLYNRKGNGDTFFDPELFVEVAYSVLDNGLRDLPSMLGNGGADSAFLVDVARNIFDVLTVSPSEGKPPVFKSLQLSRSDLKDLFNGILSSMTADTTWLKERPELQEGAKTIIPLVVDVITNLDNDSLKALVRSDQLSSVVAAVLTSEILDPNNPTEKTKLQEGIKEVLESIRKGGATGAQNLLKPDVLCDLLAALASTKLSAKLFGGKPSEIVEAVKKMEPVFELLRRNQTLTRSDMVNKLSQ